ncbi:MAG: helix-turn-helix domain-containing protein [Chloroflexaceae bacterium]|nr:helix-turn-helix domain-containing protein [Chloroflexaceae bacterium]
MLFRQSRGYTKTMRKSFKYRIYLTNGQRRILGQ